MTQIYSPEQRAEIYRAAAKSVREKGIAQNGDYYDSTRGCACMVGWIGVAAGIEPQVYRPNPTQKWISESVLRERGILGSGAYTSSFAEELTAAVGVTYFSEVFNWNDALEEPEDAAEALERAAALAEAVVK